MKKLMQENLYSESKKKEIKEENQFQKKGCDHSLQKCFGYWDTKQSQKGRKTIKR
jgi:hypothetical protein